MSSSIPATRIEGRAEQSEEPAAQGWRLPYLPGLDGLRAIAVMGVLLYHAGMLWLPGGFLGVEVFFVISGYLITSLLLSEWQRHGSVNLPAFWLRRARRLLPALFLVIAVTLAFCVLFLPEEVAGLRGDVLAATGYVTNWYLIFNQQSYFEVMGRPSLLQHLWSLAVEEQFYLLWPLLFVAGMRFLRRGVVLLAALGGAVASFVLMALLYQPDVDPSRIYYGTDTRAAGLLMGVSLAFVWAPWQHRAAVQAARWRWAKPLLIDLVGVGALAGIVCFFLYLDEFQPFLYQGGFAALGLVTVAAIAATVHPEARLIPRLLGVVPIRWVGLRSYGIYLWHWPVFMVTRPELDVPFDGPPLFILRMGVSLALAELSYRYVETPVRTGGLAGAWRALRTRPGVTWWNLAARRSGTAVAFLACVAICVSVVNAQPPAPPSYLSGDSVEIFSSEDISPDGGLSEALGEYSLNEDRTPQPGPATSQPTQATTHVESTATPLPTAEPTVTASATASATATATATVRVPDAVTNTGVNLRTGPGKAYPIIKVLARGEGLMLIGKLRGNGSYVVRTADGVEGWAFAAALTLKVDPANVPVVEAPPVGQPAPPAPPSTPKPVPPTLPLGNKPAPPTANASQDAPTAKPTDVPTSVPPEAPTAVPTPPPATGPVPIKITAIGDSVMLGAAKELVRVLGSIAPTEVDAVKSRQVSHAINTIRAKREAGKLGDVVVIHMGTNGTFTAKQFDQMMSLLTDVRRVIFVNVKVPRQWEANNNKVIAEGVQRYPNTVMIDWRAATAGQPALFSKDGIHLQAAGARLYGSLIAAQVQAP
ncbi:MAG: acyltransferase family protein [Chloroflexota bacterium]|nr:acyltransferase family protein [Chloroflexota bacterium]